MKRVFFVVLSCVLGVKVDNVLNPVGKNTNSFLSDPSNLPEPEMFDVGYKSGLSERLMKDAKSFNELDVLSNRSKLIVDCGENDLDNTCLRGKCEPPADFICKLFENTTETACSGFIIAARDLGAINMPNDPDRHGQFLPGAVFITASSCIRDVHARCVGKDCKTMKLWCPNLFDIKTPRGLRNDARFIYTQFLLRDFIAVEPLRNLETKQEEMNANAQFFAGAQSCNDGENCFYRGGVSVLWLHDRVGCEGQCFTSEWDRGLKLKYSMDTQDFKGTHYVIGFKGVFKFWNYLIRAELNFPWGDASFDPRSWTVDFATADNVRMHPGFLGAPAYNDKLEVVGVTMATKEIVQGGGADDLPPMGMENPGGGFTPPMGGQPRCQYRIARIDHVYKSMINHYITTVSGDPHMHSLDGLYFHFMGTPGCRYTLAEAELQNFTVASEFESYGSRAFLDVASNKMQQITVTKAIIVTYLDTEVYLGRQGYSRITITNEDGKAEVIDNPYIPFDNGELKIVKSGALGKKFDVSVCGSRNISVSWDGQYGYKINLPIMFETVGLLGNNNGNKSDDIFYHNGTQVPPEQLYPTTQPTGWGGISPPKVWGESWRISCPNALIEEQKAAKAKKHAIRLTEEEMKDNKADAKAECNGILNKAPFTKCSDSRDDTIESCAADVEECLDSNFSMNYCLTEFLCPVAAQYATTCGTIGNVEVIPAWRNDVDVCALNCPSGTVFRTCIDACTFGCFGNETAACSEKVCDEGCQCTSSEDRWIDDGCYSKDLCF